VKQRRESMLRIGSLSHLFLLVLVGIIPSWSHAAGTSHPAIGKAGICVTPQCHARLLEAAAGTRVESVHQPAADGECVSCHDLALFSGARFVKGAPSGDTETSESARAWDLALCSGCHGAGLLAPTGTTTATGFADGRRNLHALHVQAGRGRRCLTCHDPHTARQPKLLRERIPARGNARIAQEFRGEPKGGWCKTGCHAPKSYTR
jgi:predicted CXXCH cytochrome family protein